MATRKILFATSEVHPLIKTGGLADVSASLPQALAGLGQDVRIVMPGYPGALSQAGELTTIAAINPGGEPVTIIEGHLPHTQVKVWFVQHPPSFSRAGNPYLATDGSVWPDNAQRFALFCKTVVELAMNRAKLDWQPDLVHCNDWQTGLIPALLSLEYQRPASVFTIHNLAYQGIFPAGIYPQLGLPQALWSHDGLEFHHQLSFIKGGLAFADQISTVSPTYATEIQSTEFGAGLDGLLKHRHERLRGILNGIDTEQWNPSTDTNLPHTYNDSQLANKHLNKLSLLQEVGLPILDNHMVVGLISRLVHQKGIDLVLSALPDLLKLPLQFVILGSGDLEYVQQLKDWANRYPDKIALTIGYEEALSHRIEAGIDLFLMPSRFEPCGLNQMYSQCYGTPPLVRQVGGLADTVIDAVPETIRDNTATGFSFSEANAGSLVEATKRALFVFSDHEKWQDIQRTCMTKNFSWQHSAQEYLSMYDKTLSDSRA